MSNLVPKLKPITVDPNKLLLDPNNPRFITSQEDRVAEERLLDPSVIKNVDKKMFPSTANDPFRIVELMHSIQKNGWQPIDSIFVRPYSQSNYYVVLEGNRRVTAIHRLLQDEDLDMHLKNNLNEIEVMEVQGKYDAKSFERQITYLLGVRHHGSLNRWSPFAQARNIFECYLERAGFVSEDEFEWNESVAEEVADALSIKPKDVGARLSVYRAMVSVASLPTVKNGQLKDHYYSLFSEMLVRRKGALGKYIERDPNSLFLTAESAQKMEDLCHFSVSGRAGSPIRNPQEWRPFAEILGDDDSKKRQSNLERVELGKEVPSVVWAQRAEELKKLSWAKWLEKVRAIISRTQLSQIDRSDSETQAKVKSLVELLEKLNST